MRRIAPTIILTLALAACQTTVIDDELRTPPEPTETTGFQRTSVTIDPAQSFISFVGKSNLINHEGAFTDYDVTMTLDPADPTDLEDAQIVATLRTASIIADAPGLQGHLQKEDFFDAENYPEIRFTSTSITHREGDAYTITGDMVIKNVTQSMTFDAEITNDALMATGELPRRTFGVGNDSYGDKLLEETVPVQIKLVFRN